MHCGSCVKSISDSIYKVEGISKVEANLKDQLVTIEGTGILQYLSIFLSSLIVVSAAPSAIVRAIKDTGRDAILRGSGTSNSAAVCILETHAEDSKEKVKGLARMVQVSSNMTLIDLTIRGLSPGKYWATVRETGDISRGVISAGGIWGALFGKGVKDTQPKGVFGTVDVRENGEGAVFIDKPLQIWEMIGRSFVVSKQHDGTKPYEKNDKDTLVGVVARSAGVWDNDKTVCSCSGKTLWEERKDEVRNGML